MKSKKDDMPGWTQLTVFLKTLNNETRQQILLELFGGGCERTVNQVAEEKLGQSTASKHFTQMKRTGIPTSRRLGKEVL